MAKCTFQVPIFESKITFFCAQNTEFCIIHPKNQAQCQRAMWFGCISGLKRSLWEQFVSVKVVSVAKEKQMWTSSWASKCTE